MKRHPHSPQTQGMPVNVGDDAEREGWMPQYSPANAMGCGRTECATEACDEKGARLIVQIDACNRSISPHDKTKGVVAANLAKWRYMKNFLSTKLLALEKGLVVRVGEKVDMPLSKRVVDLGQNGPQRSVRVMAKPKADGLESVAPHAWKAMEPNGPLQRDA